MVIRAVHMNHGEEERICNFAMSGLGWVQPLRFLVFFRLLHQHRRRRVPPVLLAFMLPTMVGSVPQLRETLGEVEQPEFSEPLQTTEGYTARLAVDRHLM